MPGPSSITDLVAAATPRTSREEKAWGNDGFTFGDLVDMVNPLQHIPVVSWAYRALTGDAISGTAKVLGGGLFGGPVGLVVGAADSLWQQATGRDAGQSVMAFLKGDVRSPGGAVPDRARPAAVQVAERAPPPTAAPTQGLSNGQDALLMAQFGTPEQPLTAAAVQPRPGPAWEMAAATLPQDQVALLLHSVGLLAAAKPDAQDAAPPVEVDPAMPAAPVALVTAAAMKPVGAVVPDDLAAARAAGDELRRLYGRP